MIKRLLSDNRVFLIKIDKNPLKSRTSIPFGGPICINIDKRALMGLAIAVQSRVPVRLQVPGRHESCPADGIEVQ